MTDPSKAEIDRLVFELHPALRLVEAMATAATSLYAGKENAPDFSAQMAQLEAARAKVRALTAAERNALLATSRDREKAAQAERERVKRQAKEAARFYNQPGAMARFDVWCGADFWTVDEAAALLLGRDPDVVNPASLDRELTEGTGLLGLGERPDRAEFHRLFDGLRRLLGRADGAARSQVKPAEAAMCAAALNTIKLPPAIQALIPAAMEPEPTATVDDPAPAPPGAHNDGPYLKRAALIRLYERDWRTIESDIRHANENGLTAAAKAPGHGMWDETLALAWARERGKLKRAPAPLPGSGLDWKDGRQLASAEIDPTLTRPLHKP